MHYLSIVYELDHTFHIDLHVRSIIFALFGAVDWWLGARTLFIGSS